jgi:hypothetical protein
MTLCDQFCGTHIHFVDGIPYNDSNNKPHKDTCSAKIKAREFEGYYNMIQIDTIKPMLKQIIATIEYVEAKNKPLAEAFIKRKQKGRERNKRKVIPVGQSPSNTPSITVASELFTK